MALTQEIINESEIARSTVVNSDLDDSSKKSLLHLIDTAKIATNGISPEEKIQKMTEAIHLLTMSQITFISTLDDRIEKSIQKANAKQCESCKAMKHANDIEEQKKHEEYLEAWKKANGIKDDDVDVDTKSILGIIKTILVKPYAWIFASVLVFSPYGVDILKMIFQAFGKGS